ncbi:MAG: CpsD/CapB family tyrosine-protein kinase, partial [Clostridiales bacterium]|nr:CpsD/CapB family tyrosine-protein kinase [Clostridiales bacterium]
SGQAPIDGAKRAKELLENVNANIIGVVLNKIPTNRKGYSQYYYYQYYEEPAPKQSKKRSRANG